MQYHDANMQLQWRVEGIEGIEGTHHSAGTMGGVWDSDGGGHLSLPLKRCFQTSAKPKLTIVDWQWVQGPPGGYLARALLLLQKQQCMGEAKHIET